jgi:putative ATPase
MAKRTVGSGPDLFEAAAEVELGRRAPLAARMRPRTLDDVAGQQHLVGAGAPLRRLVESDRLSSAVLWGPPGTGKTTFARIIAETTAKRFEPLSAVTAGVKDVRDVVEAARRSLGAEGRGTILFLDEVHRFNKAQQDALLPAVEEGLVVLVGATTENPFFSLNAPLMSRSTLWRFEPLSQDDLVAVARRALAAEAATADDGALFLLADLAEGDARAVLTTLEVALALAGGRTVTVDDVEAARTTRALRHGQDEHYDLVSALIKSVRGSDPDAGLYWLARLVTAGEDPRFLARRLVILASEDVGMADPIALLVANAAAHAVEYVGLPEAGLNLAQVVVHLACAPKSNRSATAWWRAMEDVQQLPAAPPPPALRSSSYRGARQLGHGAGYDYPHDDPRGWVPAEYRPPEVAGRRYYEPTDRGAEAPLGPLLEERRRATEGEPGRQG